MSKQVGDASPDDLFERVNGRDLQAVADRIALRKGQGTCR